MTEVDNTKSAQAVRRNATEDIGGGAGPCESSGQFTSVEERAGAGTAVRGGPGPEAGAGTGEGSRVLKRRRPTGPVVWWARNDLRLEDNPIVRTAVGEALLDGRCCAPVFIFDPRFLDYCTYGRATDPRHVHSIPTRKPVDFGARKCGALRARFWLQCVRALARELEARGSGLLVCHGRAEDVLGALPEGSLVVCQQEPVSVEGSDVEAAVQKAVERRRGELWAHWGAMGLYHWEDLPFCIHQNMPSSYTALSTALGWKDIWTSAEQWDPATVVRTPVAAPSTFPEVLPWANMSH